MQPGDQRFQPPGDQRFQPPSAQSSWWRVAGIGLAFLAGVTLVFFAVIQALPDGMKSTNPGTAESLFSVETTISITVTVTEFNALYRIDQSGYYQLGEKRSVSKTQITIDGEVMPTVEEVDTELPDTSIGEYNRYNVVRRSDGTVYLLEELRDSHEGHPLALSFEGEIEFIQGDWDAYLLGRDVTVKYTKVAFEEYNKELKKQFLTQIVAGLEPGVKASLEQRLKEATGSRNDDAVSLNVTSDLHFTKMVNSEMIMNKQDIRITEDRPTEMEFEFRATASVD